MWRIISLSFRQWPPSLWCFLAFIRLPWWQRSISTSISLSQTLSKNIISKTTLLLFSHVVTFWKHILTGWPWLPPPSRGPFKLSSTRPRWPTRLSRLVWGPWSALKTPRATSTSGEDLRIQSVMHRFLGLISLYREQKINWNDQETSYLYIPNAAVGAIIGKRNYTMVWNNGFPKLKVYNAFIKAFPGGSFDDGEKNELLRHF